MMIQRGLCKGDDADLSSRTRRGQSSSPLDDASAPRKLLQAFERLAVLVQRRRLADADNPLIKVRRLGLQQRLDARHRSFVAQFAHVRGRPPAEEHVQLQPPALPCTEQDSPLPHRQAYARVQPALRCRQVPAQPLLLIAAGGGSTSSGSGREPAMQWHWPQI